MNVNYLKKLRDIYNLHLSLKEVTFVLGNSSCDMDSALSAYLLSMGKNISEKVFSMDKKNNNVNISIATDKVYIPVLNCKRGTLPYRIDEKYVFDMFGIDENDFWYISDEIFDKSNLFQNHKNLNLKTSIILVDFNKLGEDQEYLSDYVVEIYDHHQVKKLDFPKIKCTTIKYPLGSCTTLILLEYFMKEFPMKLVSPAFSLSALLLDTENFKDSLYKNRWIDLDKIVFEAIKANITDKNFNMDDYYKGINDAKCDEQKNLDLGLDALLIKDQKFYDWGDIKIIWSAFAVPFYKIQERYGLLELITYFYPYFTSKTQEEIKNTFYITYSDYDENHKFYTIYNPYEIPIDINLLKGELEQKLKKGEIPVGQQRIQDQVVGVFYYMTLDKTCSRKVMEPILREIFTRLISK